MLRFYTDEHIPNAVAHALRARGVDILTTAEASLLGASDAAQLEFASSENRVILTKDRDFLRLHAAGTQHAGVAYSRFESTIGDLIRWVLLLREVLSPEEMVNHVEFL